MYQLDIKDVICFLFNENFIIKYESIYENIHYSIAVKYDNEKA